MTNVFATIGYRGAVTTVAPNTEASINTHLWTGPKDQKEMAETANHLDLTADYGWAVVHCEAIILVINHYPKSCV